MQTMKSTALILALITTVAQGDEATRKDLTPEAVVAGFETRVEQMFRSESGKPLVRAKKNPPLGPGRGNYVRAYSYSMMAFAARCLYLNEMLDEANAALAENAQHYLDNPLDINDRDSFHWHAEIVLRLIEMYGSDGSKHAGRITKETEALALKPIWKYVKKVSWLGKAEYEKSKTWHIYLSENHHAMSFTVCWHFSKIASKRPEYKDLTYDDGATAAEHYRAWSDYFVVYCRERGRKSPCIEMMSDDYNSTLIKGFYNFHDFGEPEVRRSARMLLDLYFAYWAQEQIDGVQGGGRSRIYFYKGLKQNRNHGNAPLAWFYFGIGKQPAVYGHDMDAALSDYRPPAVVADIALNVKGRGRYEVRQRPQGLGVTGRPMKTAVTKVPTKMRTDGGGILRYSYCDPAFIMGTPMTEARPLSDWAAISAQNRWQGVIFAGKDDARIVPIVRPKDNRVALNAQWSVQSKGSLITQKLKHHKGGAEMIVWMSKEGLSTPVEEDGVVFLEAEDAYAAIRVAKGGFEWMKDKFETDRSIPENSTMVLKDEYAPVILEVMAKSDVKNYDAFKAKVKAREISMEGPVLRYKTIYGDQLTFDTSTKQVPSVNSKPVNYAPKKVFESPFLNADWNSGVVTISKGKRKKVLDFTKQAEYEAIEDRSKKTVENAAERKAFERASAATWRKVFSDACTGDWKEKWFLDGKVGTVTTGTSGMTLSAGPEFKNDAHHMVLWTKESFAGDLKIEYDYTRLDNETRCVTILYIQATGSGEAPYVKDITKWNELRRVPAMRMYYDHMNAYHISYAVGSNSGKDRTSYIRGRRYMPNKTGLKGTALKPDYYPEGLFATGLKHHITVIKKDRDLFMRIENPDQVYYCHMANPDLPIITEGRIGLRHMFTRSACYKNLRISTPIEHKEETR
jgi:hypothetical protein